MRRVAFINEKGGTCKTTLCVHVGAWLAAERGRRVLLVDVDTQGHAGKSLGLDVRELRPTVHDWLLDPALPVERVVRPTAVPGLDLLPANKALQGFPVAVAAAADRERRLAERLDALPPGRWDLVLVDAPPSLSLVTENVLEAATDVVIPVALTYLALDGCAEILRSLEERRARGRAAPRVALVVPALHRPTRLADEILAKLGERFPDALARTALPWAVKVDEAQGFGRTVFAHAPGSAGARALAALADELAERLAAGG